MTLLYAIMGLASRKFYVWLISLGAVLTIYLLYSQLSETPKIDTDRGAESTDTAAESKMSEFDSGIGRIGDVGVGTVRKAKYVHLNAEMQVDRVFGFEKLLHEEGDEWEIERPYMNIFRPNLKYYITADKGKVQIEDVIGRASPKDATFSGNVVIHILPESSGNIKESFIYLDDIIFISEKSQFSTAGPVKFVSQDTQMLGRGLEFVYNERKDRLEFLRIIHLDSLRLKTSSKASLFSSGQRDAGSSVDSSQGQTQRSAEPVAAGEPQRARPAASKQIIEQEKGQYYRCVFSKNVVIDCPEQLIFADEASINNILWSRASNRESEKPDATGIDNVKTFAEIAEESATSRESKADAIGADTTEDHNTPAAKQNELDELPEESVNIVVTCDNGIIVTPMDSPAAPESSTKPGSTKSLDDSSGRTTFAAQRIDYCAVTEDTVASGPSELTFYTKDITGAETEETIATVKVTTRKQARFLPALNQAIFDGRCLCTMLRADANYQQKYTLSAPKLTVNLGSRVTGHEARIEHLTATGGVVRLATLKMAAEGLLGGIELKCRKFDYDTAEQLFLATGPGLIKADNSNVPEPKAKLGRFSLRRRCYAIMQNFDTLRYSLQTNQIIANAEREAIFINYFPIVQDQYGQQVIVTSNHIEALLYEGAGGRTELSTLRAAGGITYEEETDKTKKKGKGKDIQFVGSEMFYDANRSIITVQGDELQPCYFNGALVDAIGYDLKTGKIKTKITAPGILQMNPR